MRGKIDLLIDTLLLRFSPERNVGLEGEVIRKLMARGTEQRKYSML